MKKLICISALSTLLLTACVEGPAIVTKDEFDKLTNGMTYDEVKEVVGGEAKSERAIEEDHIVEFTFYSEIENDEVSLIFVDGELDHIFDYPDNQEIELTPEDKERIDKNYQETQRRVLEKDITQIVNDSLGEKNNLDKSTVGSVEISEGNLNIVLNGSNNFTNTAIRDGLWSDSAKTLEMIEKSNKFKNISVQWQFPMIDVNGNEKEEVVMSFDIDREALNQINWDNFASNNIPNVTNGYFEHPAFNN